MLFVLKGIMEYHGKSKRSNDERRSRKRRRAKKGFIDAAVERG